MDMLVINLFVILACVFFPITIYILPLCRYKFKRSSLKRYLQSTRLSQVMLAIPLSLFFWILIGLTGINFRFLDGIAMNIIYGLFSVFVISVLLGLGLYADMLFYGSKTLRISQVFYVVVIRFPVIALFFMLVAGASVLLFRSFPVLIFFLFPGVFVYVYCAVMQKDIHKILA